jgi:hypothetical protein
MKRFLTACLLAGATPMAGAQATDAADNARVIGQPKIKAD